jgi:hypothetical protein
MPNRFLRCAPAVAALIACSFGAASAGAADAPAKPAAKSTRLRPRSISWTKCASGRKALEMNCDSPGG